MCSPASSAGEPGWTTSTWTPSGPVEPSIPRYARSTWPADSSCGITVLAVSTGTAKPIPTLPPVPLPVAIWELIPTTRPRASSSGPPELPGLSAASVWITLSIRNPLGAVRRR